MKNLLILLLLSCISCSNNHGTDINGADSLLYIQIAKPDISSLQPLFLSEFSDSIEYVQLETTSECLLPYYVGGYMSEINNLLFVCDFSAIYQFDIVTGKFLRRIGRRGQGPGEYQQVNMTINANDHQILLKTPGKNGLLTYNFEGKYLGDMHLDNGQDSIFSTCFFSLGLAGIGSGFFIFCSSLLPAKQACQPYELIIYDYKDKKILYSLPNRMEGKYERYSNSINGLSVCVKSSDDVFLYKSFYNDTLYAISRNGITPYAIIDLGKRKFPVNIIFSQTIGTDMDGKILINSIFMNKENIYLKCMLIKESILNVNYFICKYNIITHKITYHSPRIVNDLDGGSNVDIEDFSFSHAIIPVYPFDEVKDEYKQAVFSTLDKSKIKYPELKEKFEHMQASRNPDDNPLLMILHLKNDK